MNQVFRPYANTIARLSVVVAALSGILLLYFVLVQNTSPYTYGVGSAVGIAVDQPVRFSHELHSGQLNISCQYCHTSVEKASYAGIADTHTCMSCHSQIATYSELLEPVRSSYANGEPLVWNPVHNLADHVYFNHSSHVTNGVACETCHGRVDQMPLVWQAETMTMGWCLECHRNPEQFVRPLSEVYTFGWEVPENHEELGAALVEEYGIDSDRLQNCAICHH